MFGERLKDVLDYHNMSQIKLAQKLGVDKQIVNRWCQNVTEPDNRMIVRVAQILGVSTDYLLGNDENITETEEQIKKRNLILSILIEYGYIENNQKISNKEINRLFKFLKANKEFLDITK